MNGLKQYYEAIPAPQAFLLQANHRAHTSDQVRAAHCLDYLHSQVPSSDTESLCVFNQTYCTHQKQTVKFINNFLLKPCRQKLVSPIACVPHIWSTLAASSPIAALGSTHYRSSITLIPLCHRVHLQHMGHPIANDLQYGGTYPGPRPPFLIPGTEAAKRFEAGDSLGPPVKRQRLSQPADGDQSKPIHPSFPFLRGLTSGMVMRGIESNMVVAQALQRSPWTYMTSRTQRPNLIDF